MVSNLVGWGVVKVDLEEDKQSFMTTATTELMTQPEVASDGQYEMSNAKMSCRGCRTVYPSIASYQILETILRNVPETHHDIFHY